MQVKSGDYTFTVSELEGWPSETKVKVTDYLGTDMGFFYGDVNDTVEDVKAMGDAYIREMEDPSYT